MSDPRATLEVWVPVATRYADERAFLLSFLIALAIVIVLVAVILVARRHDLGPVVAGGLALAGVLLALVLGGGIRSSDQAELDCYAANPSVYVEGTGIAHRGWSWADMGSVAIWRGERRTLRITC